MCIVILPGQYYDEETGLHYNYHRYYDPTSGRYLRADPIDLLGGINLYVYAANNPINSSDQYGLLDAKSAHDYWTEVGVSGADRAISGGAWDSVLGNSQAAGAAMMSSFIDFFGARTLQTNAELWGHYSAGDECEWEQLKYGALTIGQVLLEAGALDKAWKLGKWMGRPFWRYVGPHSKDAITWLTRGLGSKSPFGTNFLKAAEKLHLLDYGGVPTDVVKVPYKMLKPIAGPRLVKAWGKYTGAVEYYYGKLFFPK